MNKRWPQKTALTIAGSDPTGGAGIQADLRVFDSLGLQGLSVIAALTAQNAGGVEGVFPVDGDAFVLQLETLLNETRVDGVKTGMFLTAENVRITARLLKKNLPEILVIDPVINASNGVPLLEEEGMEVLVSELFPLASIVTPNLSEAQSITGMEQPRGVGEDVWMEQMCKKIFALGPAHVVITGGHRREAPVDLLYDGKEFTPFPSKRAAGELHGSGCLFSSALCANLIMGRSMDEAVGGAKKFVFEQFLK